MKNKGLYLLFVVLAVLALVIYFTDKQGTLKKELRDFAVEDTSSVTRIFLVDKENRSITLDRKGKSKWAVNGKYIARQDAVNILLETMAAVDVKSPVSKSSLSNVIRQLAGKSVKVEIYKGEEQVKVYYVGGPTQDQTGTYMILQNSSVPFVTHKPGFFGYLSVRYFTDEDLWRDNIIFSYSFSEIAQIIVRHPLFPMQSFSVYKVGNNNFRVEDSQGNEVSGIENQYIKEFFARYRNVKAESFLKNFKPHQLDSLLKITPLCVLSVIDAGNDTNSISLYRRPNFQHYLDGGGNELPFDPDAMYGLINKTNEVVICQYFVFDPLMVFLSDSKKNKPVL